MLEMTGHYNRHMYNKLQHCNKLQLPHPSILFTFTGGKHLLTDRFFSSKVARLFQACSASHLSHPLAIQGLMSFAMAHAEVQVPDTLSKEPGVLWLAIGMPTGKTILVSNVSSSNLFNATWCIF